MMMHPGYFKLLFNGQFLYQCCTCKFDSFDESVAKQHCIHSFHHLELPATGLDTTQWFDTHIAISRRREKIVVGFLTWNTVEASTLAAKAIGEEIRVLRMMGLDAECFWLDNGSDDGTVAMVSPHLYGYGQSLVLPKNMGQSYARNKIIEHAVDEGADYLIFIDGDIQPIRFSLSALYELMFIMPFNTGCIGLYSHNCTADEYDLTVSTECRRINMTMLQERLPIAWTQYGIFNMTPFFRGLRFDESEAFQGPGWGFEDDDLGLALQDKGYKSYHTKFFRYLHRHRHSSLRLLDAEQSAATFLKRRSYLLSKWGNVEHAKAYVGRLQNQQLPDLDKYPKP